MSVTGYTKHTKGNTLGPAVDGQHKINSKAFLQILSHTALFRLLKNLTCLLLDIMISYFVFLSCKCVWMFLMFFVSFSFLLVFSFLFYSCFSYLPACFLERGRRWGIERVERKRTSRWRAGRGNHDQNVLYVKKTLCSIRKKK